MLEFAINGIPIEGPDTMTETGPDTGQFHVRLELPPTVDGRPITHNDVVDVTYIDPGGQIGREPICHKIVHALKHVCPHAVGG